MVDAYSGFVRNVKRADEAIRLQLNQINLQNFEGERNQKILNFRHVQRYNARPYGLQSKLSIGEGKYKFDQCCCAHIGNPVS